MAGPTATAARMSDPMYGAPQVGECHKFDLATYMSPYETSEPVDCFGANGRVLAVVPLTPGFRIGHLSKPDSTRLSRSCDAAFRRAVGGTAAMRAMSAYTMGYFFPTEEQQAQGARWARCDVVMQPTGTRLVQLPREGLKLTQPIGEAKARCLGEKGNPLPCIVPHSWRVVSAHAIGSKSYPSRASMVRLARRSCPATAGRVWHSTWPSKEYWPVSPHYLLCFRRGR